jgi:hypothetical protein
MGSRIPTHWLKAASLIAALALGACGNDPVSREVVSWFPGQGPATFPGAPDERPMVQPGADCRQTLGISDCYIYIAPPGRPVPTTPVIPGAAQIHPGNGGGPGFVASQEPIPTGLYMTQDGMLVPLEAKMAARPVPPGTRTAALPPLPVTAGPSPADARTAGKPAPRPVAAKPPAAPAAQAGMPDVVPAVPGATVAQPAAPVAPTAPVMPNPQGAPQAPSWGGGPPPPAMAPTGTPNPLSPALNP